MPENRKYLPEEINYVLSRVLAGWKHEDIAETFKRDHAPYWADKEFTRKQVSYIKNTYKIPPGTIEPYQEPEPPQQEYFTASPLTRLLMMTPTQQQATQPKNEAVAPSSGSNDNMSGFVGHQSSFNASTAIGLTTAQSSSGIQAEGVTLNPTIYGSNDFLGFNDLNNASGYMNPNTNTNQTNSGNALHGDGDHFNFGNANANAPLLNAEDQAFLDEMLPVIDNEQAANAQAQNGGGLVLKTAESPQQALQQQTGNQFQMVASSLQDLSTSVDQPERGQQQVQEVDTVMQSIKHEPDIMNNDDGKTPTPTAATVAGGPNSGDYTFPYSPPFDINATSVHQSSVPIRGSVPQHPAPPTPQLPGYVRLHPSLERAVAAMNDQPPAAALRTLNSQSSPSGGVIDFYFGPHGTCPIELEHGHHSTNGSLIFRSDTKFHETFAAMKRKENAGYLSLPGLANGGINQGLQSLGGCSPYSPEAVAAAQAPHGQAAFERAYRQTQAQGYGPNAASLPWIQSPQGAGSNAGTTAQARATWTRGPSMGYYDVYSGSKGDYQGINPGTRAANRANPQNDHHGEGLNMSSRGHHQSQQAIEPGCQPPSMPYCGGVTLSPPRRLAPLQPFSVGPYHHGSAPNLSPSPHFGGLGSGYATSFGQNGGAPDGMIGGLTRQQQEVMLTGSYQAGLFDQVQQQQVGAQAHGYTCQMGGIQQQQAHNQQRLPRPGESAHHPMHLDNGSSGFGSYPVEDEKNDNDFGPRYH